MKRFLLAPLVIAPLAIAGFCITASAADGPMRRPIVYAPPAGLSPDELRDYHMDQLESRQEMERRALRLRQQAERRAIDPEDDD